MAHDNLRSFPLLRLDLDVRVFWCIHILLSSIYSPRAIDLTSLSALSCAAARFFLCSRIGVTSLRTLHVCLQCRGFFGYLSPLCALVHPPSKSARFPPFLLRAAAYPAGSTCLLRSAPLELFGTHTCWSCSILIRGCFRQVTPWFSFYTC